MFVKFTRRCKWHHYVTGLCLSCEGAADFYFFGLPFLLGNFNLHRTASVITIT